MLGVGPFVARSVCGALNRNLSGGTHHPFLYGTTTCSRADHYYYRTKPVSGHSGSFAGPNERCCGTPIKGFTWVVLFFFQIRLIGYLQTSNLLFSYVYACLFVIDPERQKFNRSVHSATQTTKYRIVPLQTNPKP